MAVFVARVERRWRCARDACHAGPIARGSTATLAAMFTPRSIKHCRACGGAVRYAVPADDNRDRAVCTVCTHDPLREPAERRRHGAGLGRPGAALPAQHRAALRPVDAAGRLHGARRDAPREGALRETVEEAGAHVELEGLFTVLNVVRVGQVHLFYRARCSTPTSTPARRRSRRGCSAKTRSPGTSSRSRAERCAFFDDAPRRS